RAWTVDDEQRKVERVDRETGDQRPRPGRRSSPKADDDRGQRERRRDCEIFEELRDVELRRGLDELQSLSAALDLVVKRAVDQPRDVGFGRLEGDLSLAAQVAVADANEPITGAKGGDGS